MLENINVIDKTNAKLEKFLNRIEAELTMVRRAEVSDRKAKRILGRLGRLLVRYGYFANPNHVINTPFSPLKLGDGITLYLSEYGQELYSEEFAGLLNEDCSMRLLKMRGNIGLIVSTDTFELRWIFFGNKVNKRVMRRWIRSIIVNVMMGIFDPDCPVAPVFEGISPQTTGQAAKLFPSLE